MRHLRTPEGCSLPSPESDLEAPPGPMETSSKPFAEMWGKRRGRCLGSVRSGGTTLNRATHADSLLGYRGVTAKTIFSPGGASTVPAWSLQDQASAFT